MEHRAGFFPVSVGQIQACPVRTACGRSGEGRGRPRRCSCWPGRAPEPHPYLL